MRKLRFLQRGGSPTWQSKKAEVQAPCVWSCVRAKEHALSRCSLRRARQPQKASESEVLAIAEDYLPYMCKGSASCLVLLPFPLVQNAEGLLSTESQIWSGCRSIRQPGLGNEAPHWTPRLKIRWTEKLKN